MNTLFIGQNRVELVTVNSTNNYALELAKTGRIADGTLVWAHEQTAGRGQRGNGWQSSPDLNITLSIILRPELDAYKQFYLTKAVSLGVKEFVEDLIGNSSEVRVKWPNDIYVGDKKIAGILIENILRGEQINTTVIGIGLNVNQCGFSADLKNVISLKLITGKTYDIKTGIDTLCEHIEPRYLQLKTNKHNLLDADYHKNLYRLDKLCEYEKDGTLFKATLIGVNGQGKLLLKLEKGETLSCDFKEVGFL
ncbi:MAG: biotin--[acetyl-CoA-carboxylase] ligase [Bacteroidetes bacterium]|nr:biotin--[acetyl-CoA-carboxylase] ligase [Bacteroidota bacterium]